MTLESKSLHQLKCDVDGVKDQVDELIGSIASLTTAVENARERIEAVVGDYSSLDEMLDMAVKLAGSLHASKEVFNDDTFPDINTIADLRSEAASLAASLSEPRLQS